MRLVTVTFGRGVRGTPWQPLCDDFASRIRRYAKLDEIESREDRDDKVERQVNEVLASVGPRAHLVVMDVNGQRLTSEQFSQTMGEWLDASSIPVFVIGGAEGLPASVRAKARAKLSLGSMTLPHKLARTILLEQVYRGFTLLRGEPYAREG